MSQVNNNLASTDSFWFDEHETLKMATNDNCHFLLYLSHFFPIQCIQSHSHAFFLVYSLTQMWWNECRIVFSKAQRERPENGKKNNWGLSCNWFVLWYCVDILCCTIRIVCMFLVNKNLMSNCVALYWRFVFVLSIA